MWIRFLELPIELYNSYILPQLAAKIGIVLKVDYHTLMGDKGKYARVCVQIDLNRPLIKTIYIGSFKQTVVYEGINGVCFACGRVGHQKWSCPYTPSKLNLTSDQKEDSQLQASIQNGIAVSSSQIVDKTQTNQEDSRSVEKKWKINMDHGS